MLRLGTLKIQGEVCLSLYVVESVKRFQKLAYISPAYGLWIADHIYGQRSAAFSKRNSTKLIERIIPPQRARNGSRYRCGWWLGQGSSGGR
jgi:hypothetical protein